jgi:hypothetical protein
VIHLEGLRYQLTISPRRLLNTGIALAIIHAITQRLERMETQIAHDLQELELTVSRLQARRKMYFCPSSAQFLGVCGGKRETNHGDMPIDDTGNYNGRKSNPICDLREKRGGAAESWRSGAVAGIDVNDNGGDSVQNSVGDLEGVQCLVEFSRILHLRKKGEKRNMASCIDLVANTPPKARDLTYHRQI